MIEKTIIRAGLHYPFDVVGCLIVAVVVSYAIVKLSRLFDPLLGVALHKIEVGIFSPGMINWIIFTYDSIFGKRNRSNTSSRT
ncbi:hypothetical protein [Peribacillus loiseleuriae]|uniref:hypothetical protein n=1 Tax=Peribacillus loiseleuriae TaxID=1679170 RepID=UPI003D059B1A